MPPTLQDGVEQKAKDHVLSCKERMGYPFKVVGHIGAVACCVSEFPLRALPRSARPLLDRSASRSRNICSLRLCSSSAGLARHIRLHQPRSAQVGFLTPGVVSAASLAATVANQVEVGTMIKADGALFGFLSAVRLREIESPGETVPGPLPRSPPLLPLPVRTSTR